MIYFLKLLISHIPKSTSIPCSSLIRIIITSSSSSDIILIIVLRIRTVITVCAFILLTENIGIKCTICTPSIIQLNISVSQSLTLLSSSSKSLLPTTLVKVIHMSCCSRRVTPIVMPVVVIDNWIRTHNGLVSTI